MSYTSLKTNEDWNRILEVSKEKPVLVFKHSTTCPISAAAHREWQKWLEAKGDQCESALVRVIEERPLSMEIQDTLGVKHASPQAILIKNGRAEWNASHWKITKKALEDNVR